MIECLKIKKLFKYVALSLVGLVGFNTLSSIFSKSGSDVEKQVVNSLGQEMGVETNSNVEIENQPEVVAKKEEKASSDYDEYFKKPNVKDALREASKNNKSIFIKYSKGSIPDVKRPIRVIGFQNGENRCHSASRRKQNIGF